MSCACTRTLDRASSLQKGEITRAPPKSGLNERGAEVMNS